MEIKDFFSFEKMITPALIKVIFIILLIGSLLLGLSQIIIGIRYSGLSVLSGIVTLVLGPFLSRIFCEGMIVIFQINETLTKIEKKK